MIIKITQTASNIKQCYEIEGDGLYYHGEAGSISRLQPITLTNQTETLRGKYHVSNIVNYIPFRYLFGRVNLIRGFDITRNGESVGGVIFSQHGFLKSFYVITWNDNTCLRCYTVGNGSFQYSCIYDYNCGSEKQIALIETYLNVNDYKYVHKVYLLDDYKVLASVISFFTVYYASYDFSKRFHMNCGSIYGKRMIFSSYNDKYDPAWREINFPGEYFFGKVSLL